LGAFLKSGKPVLAKGVFPALFWFWGLAFAFLPQTPAAGQGVTVPSSSYITPFPPSDRYQLRVLGDWLGSGLTSGLQEAFKQDGALEISDMSRSNYGLARADQTDMYAELDRMLSGTPVQIVVILLGTNDRAWLKTPGGRAQPGSQEWKDAYGKEVEKLIKKLRAANIAVYWVGLPPMGNALLSEAAAAMNDAARQAAYLSGAKFIETWSGFTDQTGAYSAFGPDLTGQTKRLREGDGIAMTAPGNRKLASYVEIVLRRDLAQARAQRNIPLAGDEEEQARIVPGKAGKAAAEGHGFGPNGGEGASASAAFEGGGGKALARTRSEAAQDTLGSARHDRAAFAGSGFEGGDFVLNDLGNGLTGIAVITPVNDFSIREIQRQTPLSERIYFKVLSKGEALPAKEGRADDFSWRGDEAAQSQ